MALTTDTSFGNKEAAPQNLNEAEEQKEAISLIARSAWTQFVSDQNPFINIKNSTTHGLNDYKCHAFIKNDEIRIYAHKIKKLRKQQNEQENRIKRFAPALLFTVDASSFSIKQIKSVAWLSNKIDPTNQQNSDEIYKEMQREQEILKRFLGKTGICQLLDSAEYVGKHNKKETKKVVIYEELYGKGDFVDVINKGLQINLRNINNQDCRKLVKYVMDILEGLVYLHENNWIHRDIKADNLLADENSAVISDFDTVREDLSEVLSSSNGGSINYFSPERLERWRSAILKKKSSKKTTTGKPEDVWGIGIVLYGLCLGQLPIWFHLMTSLCTTFRQIAYIGRLHKNLKRSSSYLDNLKNTLKKPPCSPKMDQIKTLLTQQKEKLDDLWKEAKNFETSLISSEIQLTIFNRRALEIKDLGINTQNQIKELKPKDLNTKDVETINKLLSKIEKKTNLLLKAIWEKLDASHDSNDPYFQLAVNMLKRDPAQRLTARDAYEAIEKLYDKQSQ